MITKFFRNNYLLLLIIFVGAFLRLYKLGSVPPGISHDEVDYIANGFSILKTGTDLYGQSGSLTIGGIGYSVLPAIFSIISTAFLPISLFAVRLTPALFGIISIFLIYLISIKLFSSKTVAILSATILALSPWGIQISRWMFDPPTSCFLFLLGISLSLYANNLKKLFLGFFVISIGFLTYFGSIFFFLPTIFILSIYRSDIISNKKWLLVGFFLLAMYLVMWHKIQNIDHGGLVYNRTGTLVITDTQHLSDEVVFERFNSSGPIVLNRIFINKVTVALREFFNNYLEAFSLKMIFVNGDPNRIFSLWSGGELNLVLLPALFSGLYALFRRPGKQCWFVIGFLLIAPLTAGLSTPVYATRSFLLWPFLIIICALGVNLIFTNLKRANNPLKISLIIVSVLSFSYFSLLYLHQYFFRYPIYASEIWVESEQQLARYLGERPDHHLVIYAPEARQMFMQYIFYNGFNPKDVQKVLDKENILSDINYRNLTFVNGCPNVTQPPKLNLITHHTCYPDKKFFTPIIISADRSDRAIWFISQDD